jgi:hypothetical protein
MEKVVSVIQEREEGIATIRNFPWITGLILIITPLGHGLFDVSGVRILFHYSVRVCFFSFFFFFFFLQIFVYNH